MTGGSRGVGRGAAIALASFGFRVFATGRFIEAAKLPESVVRIPCDHTRNDETEQAFSRLTRESGRLDILVNAAWGGYERMVEDGAFTWGAPFWDQPEHRWTSMIDAGVRAAFVASCHAARLMVPQHSGLVVNLSYWAAQKYLGNVIYGAAKAATDKMSADMAHELRPYNVACLSLYPGLVRTEAVVAAAKDGWLDLSNSESPEFIGRVIAALTNDPNLMDRSGQVLIAAIIARELNVRDIDGGQPLPLSLETA